MTLKAQSILSQKEWKDILSKVYRRAASDHQFHALCLRDAHAAIKQISGKDIPKTTKIRFKDEFEEITLMLPSDSKTKGEQLNDTQLDELATGMSLLPFYFSHRQ